MARLWRRPPRRNVWKGIAAGVAGGLAASWVMNQFQNVWMKAAEAASNGNSRRSNGRQREQQEEDPTMKTAAKIAETFTGEPLTRRQKQKGGPLVHYVFGATMGGLYGAAAEYVPGVRAWAGLPYGATLFAGADEVALPLLGLTKAPTEYPPTRHLYGLSSHFVYGATLEGVRRLIRSQW
jgi:putative membrane protein